MNLLIADHSGFCGGVKRVVKLADALIADDANRLYSLGPLIHNPQLVEKLEKEGLVVYDGDPDTLPDSSRMLIRSHGIPIDEKEMLEGRGVHMVDGTCPVLHKIYDRIVEHCAKGYTIVVIGDPEHPEIRAMIGFCKDAFIVCHTEEEASQIENYEKLYIISQTTNRIEKFLQLSDIIKELNKEVIVENTICNATRLRQDACTSLSKVVDAMVVIGGKNSSNTNKLAEIAAIHCKNVFRIESVKDLPLQKVSTFYTIGITAGASTPDWIIEEVVERMDQFSSEEYLEQVEDSMIKIYPKDIVKGTVITVKDQEVFVDIKYRTDGIIKLDEVSNDENAKPQDLFEVGQEIDVYVIKLDDGEGNVVLSTRRVEGLKNWQKLVDVFNSEEIVDAQVTASNKGGLVASVMGINGFIPASQITTYYVRDLKQYVGQTLQCKIVSLDDKKRRIVLSSRVIKEAELDKVWETIVQNEVMKGTVERLTDFGAFVNLGGVDGLIHISDISWHRIKHPSDVLEVGQEVDVLVLRANKEKNRISLGLKQLTKKPFELFLENNKEGDVVTGEVVNLLDFGAFVRLKEGVEGLVHVSQISYDHVEKPSDELNVGQELEVKILEINTEEQRIALSVKALQPEPAKPQKQEKEPRKPRPSRRRESEPAYENQDIGVSIGDLFDFDFGGEEEVIAEEVQVETEEVVEVEEAHEEVADQPQEDEQQ